jgi:hypothetical protein
MIQDPVSILAYLAAVVGAVVAQLLAGLAA